jgi:hypothetical protein
MGSAKVCQGFRETEMLNDGRVVGGPKFVCTKKKKSCGNIRH